MGIFDKLFGEKNETEKAPSLWTAITDLSDLEVIRENSSEKLQVIFKHSTSCGISRGVIKQFERQMDAEKADYHYLDLLRNREISNAIATQFGVQHQSPQLLVIKEGKVIAHDSHYEIVNLVY